MKANPPKRQNKKGYDFQTDRRNNYHLYLNVIFTVKTWQCIITVRISSTCGDKTISSREVHVDLLTTGALSESFLKRIHGEEVLLYAEEDSIAVRNFRN